MVWYHNINLLKLIKILDKSTLLKTKNLPTEQKECLSSKDFSSYLKSLKSSNFLYFLAFCYKIWSHINPYPTAFPYGNGMVLHFYQQQERSTTKTVHKVINKRLKTYV